jgi:hypothetical protein
MYRFRGTPKLADKKPDWRGLTAGKLYEIAVKPRYISTLEHPVAKKLLTAQIEMLCRRVLPRRGLGV